MTDREKLMEMARNGFPKIVIHTDADFTPAGKRTARIVQVRGTFGRGRQLRWYVGGEIYDRMSPTAENIALTRKWINAQR